MMPQEGFYSRKNISAEEFKALFLAADEVISSVAYPELITLMRKELGIEIPLDHLKGQTVFHEDTATILVVKLAYRIPSERKGHNLGSVLSDYEFILTRYTREQ